MASLAAADGRFDIARVIGRTFAAIRHNAASFALLALLLAGVPALISSGGLLATLGRLSGRDGRISDDLVIRLMDQTTMLAGVSGLLGLVATAVLQAAVIYGTAGYLNGRAAGFGECLGAGLRRCLPLIGLYLVGFVALAFGFMIFIVPGVLMAVAWIAAAPALVVERTGVFGAFSRSADLTRGRRWAILGLLALYFIARMVIQQALASLVGAALSVATFQAALLNQIPVDAAVGVCFSIVASTGIASVYYELRSTREGAGPEALASVFD